MIKSILPLICGVGIYSSVSLSSEISNPIPDELLGKWVNRCTWTLEGGWGSPQAFGLKTMITISKDKITRRMSYHADEDSCSDRARATLTVTTAIEGMSGSLNEPEVGAALNERLLDAKVSIGTEYGKALFAQFTGGLRTEGHCLHPLLVGKTYDVLSCPLGDLGTMSSSDTRLYDRLELVNSDSGHALVFPMRKVDDGSAGDNVHMVLTGINEYMGATNESKRPWLLDDEKKFHKVP